MLTNVSSSKKFIYKSTADCSGGNWDERGGGGIYVRGGTFTMSGGEVSNNTANAAGGVFIDSGASFDMTGGSITENTANTGEGGGLGACSTGHVFFGTGPDGTPVAAIFGNTANGKNLSDDKSAKHADWDAYNNEVFMSSGYQDVYSALEAVISGLMLGYGDEAWTGSADGARVTVNKGNSVSASQMLGLTSNATETDRANARAAAHVFITGNHSNTHGGGIMCNGALALGWKAEMEITPDLAVKGTKQYEVKGEDAKDVPEFQFAISNMEPVWVNDTDKIMQMWRTHTRARRIRVLRLAISRRRRP